jgi:hypothetical protein
MEKKIPTYKIVVNPDDERTGVYAVSLVDEPAIEVDWIKLSKMVEYHFQANKDKQMLFGPMLIPNKLIFRKDNNGDEYNIIFDEETIQIIADKYNENKLGDVFNFQHSDRKVEAVLLQNWITGETDKSQDYGFALPKGTWFGGVKVKDEQFWNEEVKTEKVKGFSVEIMAGTQLIEMTAEADKIKEEQLMEYKTKDGLTITWEGDAEVGKDIFIILEDGSKEPLNNGEYELEDGTKVVVAAGKVAEIKAAEPADEEEMAEPGEPAAPEAAAVEAARMVIGTEVLPIFDEMRNIISELSARIDKLENVEPTAEEEATLSKVKELEERVEILSKTAGAPSITKKSDLEIKKDEKEKYILGKVEFLKSLRK